MFDLFSVVALTHSNFISFSGNSTPLCTFQRKSVRLCDTESLKVRVLCQLTIRRPKVGVEWPKNLGRFSDKYYFTV